MKNFVLFFLLFTCSFLYSQYNFGSPIDGEIKLAGNFGELRDNHFHSGIDIRTDGKEGWRVYAIEDGYVSRILMSKRGYGTALYVSHPNGLTSVYGHLSAYNDTIKNFATRCQYANEDFELDTLLLANRINVKKGELIAFSGNTGGSAGPHIHFEIRDTKTELALNPENFGFIINDIYSPRIYSVSVFTLNGLQSIFLQTLPSDKGKIITVDPGRVGVGISGIDYYSDYESNAGIYQTQLYKNDELIFEKRMDTFSFNNWRCINSHLDFEVLKTKGYRIEKCFKDDGDLTEIYYNTKNNGIINIAPGETVKLKIITKDHAGNQTQKTFTLKGGYSKKMPPVKYNLIPSNKNLLNARKAVLEIPAGALFDTCFFNFYADTTYRKYSYTYRVGSNVIPLQKEITLRIIPLINPHHKEHKLYIKSLTAGSIGGQFKDGYLTATTKTCGTYIIDIDTTPPVITPLNIPSTRNISHNSSLLFRISDSQTGVKKFKATANGKFILFSYDLKYNLINCNLREVDLSGKTNFELMVEDGCGNIKQYKTVLTKN